MASGGTGMGGAGNGGSAVPAAIDCTAPSVPANGILANFSGTTTAPNRWASSNGLTGTLFSYAGGTSTVGASLNAATTSLHFTANVVSGSYAGCGVVFDKCQSIGANKNIRFSVSGSTTCAFELQVQTYGQRPTTEMPAGSCSTAGGHTCVNYCKATGLSLATTPVTVSISSLSNWTSSFENQVVGVQWQLTNSGGSACTADLTFDNVVLSP